MRQKLKILLVISLMSFMSAACNPFESPEPVIGGVIKTLDGGASYRFYNLINGAQKGITLSNFSIARLRFSPDEPGVVFAASYGGGLFRSKDLAVSWDQVMAKLQTTYDFVIDPLEPKTLYACGSFNTHGKIVKSEDGGGSWNEVYTEASPENPVRSVAIGSRGEVYGALANGNLIVSLDKGSSWKPVYNFGTRINRIEYTLGRLFVLLQGTGVYASADMGNTFDDISGALRDDSFFAVLKRDRVSAFNQMYVSQNGSVYVSTNNGIYMSPNLGRNWTALVLPLYKNDVNFYAIAQSEADPNVIYAGVSNTVFQSSDGGKNWRTFAVQTAGFVNYLLPDLENPDIAYGGIFIGQ